MTDQTDKFEPPAPAPSKRLAARRQAFLEAARVVFEDKGFAAATIDEVIALSGGSRQTLYTLFGDKQGLFEALVTGTCQSIFHGMTPEKLAPQEPEAALTGFGARYLGIITSPAALSLNRLMVAEAPRIPDIAERYWTLGPGRSRAFLAEFFRRQGSAGKLRIDDAETAADHFLEMLSGTIRFKCLIGVRKPPDAAEIEAIVAKAVRQFLEGAEPRRVVAGQAIRQPCAVPGGSAARD
ncbi:transcriptional regulator, TetR family [Methylocella silvestris BL2]|uniref:Transcriptional regulator, TetR family n=1 Tax=Methylocella silvestris (strain DSM 15510 / CIP 108128 / LMG 27833 / NCIMB 13906 / BL2) TaxID=395965 RepID=B8EKK2_METSB|nr:TetR/AcrR family transcriptional regulator [Methylocella silvestris]ACK51372.1 transcriptional regulator, TetR family [Methylocella silvestris BL2]